MLLAVSGLSFALNIVVVILSLMMIFLIVVIQRGKGGGLAGALGGAGGSSAFGSKSGDVFTRATLYLAAIWVIVIMIHVKVAKNDAVGQPEAVIGAPQQSD